ncbi:MAG: TIGR04282 family arsenosugar biosynthesis glycosyltransferase [Actinomycetota bacterium]
MPAVIVIAKSPFPGRVKTRLSPPCSADQAAQIAEAALVETLSTVAATRATRHVVALDGEPGPWIPAGFELIVQRGAGLGERLGHAFCEVGCCALLVGMDTPQLGPGLIESALVELDSADAVLGPTDDGGYWAVGLRAPEPLAFTGVPMSRADTFEAQLARFEDLGLRVGLLPHLRDVDYFDDALAVAKLVPGSAFAASVAAVATEVLPV